ncbi:MAG: hypothetical protein ACREAA_17165 [Candidatus Polarisedimenticolia bacterium]
MSRETRRQASLLGVLVVLVVVYLRFGTGLGTREAVAGPADVPAIDVVAVMNSIKDVSTINPWLVLDPNQRIDSEADRNLFQYGHRKPPPPPPPTPAELEAQRKATEAALAAEEIRLREQKRIEEEQRVQADALAEQQRQEAARLAEQQAKLPPPPPPKPVAPAVNFKLMGMLGSSDRKLGVFLEGDKVMMARQGEVLMGQFKVLSIGPEYALIGYVDPNHKDETRKLHLGR